MGMNDQLKARAAKVIPNGLYGHLSVAHHSPRTPQYFAKAKGAYVWDYEDNRYMDYLCAFGPSLFGYGHEEIDASYIAELARIDAAVGPSARMVELAEAYVDQISHADWAMFCKNGGDATSIALMTARAYRDRPKVLLATGAYHGAAPWNTPMPPGTVETDRAHFIYYEYNNAESLAEAAATAGDELAGVFATPFRHEVIEPQQAVDPDYAKAARNICDAQDALLIVDDVRAGFRLDRDCSWHAIGVEPDLSSWGKSLANGHAISALMGNDRAKEAAGKIFVTGSFWYASAAMAAALTTLGLIRSTDYLERSVALGTRLREGLQSVASESGLPIHQSGPVQMPLIMINDEQGGRDMSASVAFCDGLLDHGVFFHPYHNMFINCAISEEDIDRTLEGAMQVARALCAQNAA